MVWGGCLGETPLLLFYWKGGLFLQDQPYHFNQGCQRERGWHWRLTGNGRRGGDKRVHSTASWRKLIRCTVLPPLTDIHAGVRLDQTSKDLFLLRSSPSWTATRLESDGCQKCWIVKKCLNQNLSKILYRFNTCTFSKELDPYLSTVCKYWLNELSICSCFCTFMFVKINVQRTGHVFFWHI